MARGAWLALILLIAAGLRSYRLSWGLPSFVFFDSGVFFAQPAMRLLREGDWMTSQFVHPPAVGYALAGVASVWAMLRGVDPAAYSQAELEWIGRVMMVAVSTLSVAVVYLIARRLLGTSAALLAAAAFALSPVHVLEAHHTQSDAPMLLLALLSAHQAVLARELRRPGHLWLAFVLGGLAGAVKYSGLACLSVPVWIALAWRDAPIRRRLTLVIGGAVLGVAVFAIAIAPLLLQWPAFRAKLELIRIVGMSIGQPGEDLRGEGWMYVRYVYALVAALPYVLGWAVYVAGLVGLGLLAFHRRARGPILAAVVPFFLFQGSAETVTARYYLPLAPYICMGAGFALDRAVRRWRVAGAGTVALVLGYTFILTMSLCLRIPGSTEPVAGDLREEIERAQASGRPLVLGYEAKLLVAYDPISPVFNRPRQVQVVPFPTRGLDGSLDRYRRWLESEKIDAVLLTSHPEDIALREGRRDELDFHAALGDGRLGFRLKSERETHFFTEGLYTWADPSLATHLPAGILDHKLFVRDTRMPAEQIE